MSLQFLYPFPPVNYLSGILLSVVLPFSWCICMLTQGIPLYHYLKEALGGPY